MSKQSKLNRQQKRAQSNNRNKTGVNATMETTTNPEMNEPKSNPNQGEQPEVDATKDGVKPGMFSVAMTKIKETIVGVVGFAKESFATAYNAIVLYFQEVKKNIEEKGIMRWFADGFRQKSYGFLKLSLKVTAFVLVHNLIVNATGFSILNPYFLLAFLVIAVGLSAYSSYQSQKTTTEKVSAKTMGSHIVEEMIAA